ncbi:MAG: S1C family serine protease [Gaiellaceae bacterium]
MNLHGHLSRIRIAVAVTALAAAATLVAVLASIALARTPLVGTGVVVVKTNLGYQNSSAAGTGIVLTSSGKILTNNHVIRGATTIRVVIPSSGRTYIARVVGYDVTADIALLKVNASNLRPAQLGTSSSLQLGSSVTALGNAGGTGSIVSASGTITALGQAIDVSDDQGGSEHLTGLIKTDAALQPGDSGGPLVNSAGRVIGIDTAASSRIVFGGGSEGYAIPINTARSITRLIAAGHASATVHVGGTAFLGVEVASASAYYPGVTGGTIVDVVPGSPASTAGIAGGDTITSFAGTTITAPDTLSPLVLQQKPGAKVSVGWIDPYGTSHSATVALASGPPQ